MLRDVVWSDDGMYKVGDVYNPERFFSDALNNSSEFDLQLGYFSCNHSIFRLDTHVP